MDLELFDFHTQAELDEARKLLSIVPLGKAAKRRLDQLERLARARMALVLVIRQRRIH